MRHRIALLTLCLLAAAAPGAPSAIAKDIQAATICGVDRCTEVAAEDLSIELVEGTFQVSPPDVVEPWYRVQVTVGDKKFHESWGLIVLPESGYTTTPGDLGVWNKVNAHAISLYRELTAGLEPFPATALKARLARAGLQVSSTPPAPSPPADDPGDGSGSASVAIAGSAAAVILLIGGAVVVLRRRARTA